MPRVHHLLSTHTHTRNHTSITTMGLLNSLRSKYDLYRLEQRYTRREKRTTFISGAQYVDGEYVYDVSPTSAKSSSSFGSGSSSGKASSSRMSTIHVKEVFSSGLKNSGQSRVH